MRPAIRNQIEQYFLLLWNTHFKINARENRCGNQEYTIQKHWQQRAHKHRTTHNTSHGSQQKPGTADEPSYS